MIQIHGVLLTNVIIGPGDLERGNDNDRGLTMPGMKISVEYLMGFDYSFLCRHSWIMQTLRREFSLRKSFLQYVRERQIRICLLQNWSCDIR